MKSEDIVIDKWYKFTTYNSSDQYGKISKITDTCVACDIWIRSDKSVNEHGGVWRKLDWYVHKLLTDLTEIQQYLPDNHPDKIPTQKFKVGDKVRAVAQTHTWGDVKKGDIGVITIITPIIISADFDNQKNWIGKPHCFELVEEIKEPIKKEIKEHWIPQVGDWVMIGDSELPITHNWLGEGGRITHQGPFKVNIIHGNIVNKLDDIECCLVSTRFRKATKEEIYAITKLSKHIRKNKNTDCFLKYGDYYVGTRGIDKRPISDFIEQKTSHQQLVTAIKPLQLTDNKSKVESQLVTIKQLNI